MYPLINWLVSQDATILSKISAWNDLEKSSTSTEKQKEDAIKETYQFFLTHNNQLKERMETVFLGLAGASDYTNFQTVL